MTFVINGDFNGRSVRDWLYQNGVSRALIARLKRLDDGICVNSSRVTVRYILHTGDRLSLALDDRSDDVNENLVPSEIALDIIYENDDFIALNKPAGIATHPSQGHFRDTLANGLAAYYQNQGIPFVFRAVMRLDRETSGIVLCAKNQYAASRLSDELCAGRIKKTYIALLNGAPEPPSGNISVYIRRREKSVILREVAPAEAEGAKLALTEYETLASTADVAFSNAHTGAVSTDGTLTGAMCTDAAHTGAMCTDAAHTGAMCTDNARTGSMCTDVTHTDDIRASNICRAAVVRAEPLTGRTHQLRVSFAHIGAPIVGDGLYGSAETAPTALDQLASRHMLHAVSLEFSHGGTHYILRAGLPRDMAQLCGLVMPDSLLPWRANSVETYIEPKP